MLNMHKDIAVVMHETSDFLLCVMTNLSYKAEETVSETNKELNSLKNIVHVKRKKYSRIFLGA